MKIRIKMWDDGRPIFDDQLKNDEDLKEFVKKVKLKW